MPRVPWHTAVLSRWAARHGRRGSGSVLGMGSQCNQSVLTHAGWWGWHWGATLTATDAGCDGADCYGTVCHGGDCDGPPPPPAAAGRTQGSRHGGHLRVMTLAHTRRWLHPLLTNAVLLAYRGTERFCCQSFGASARCVASMATAMSTAHVRQARQDAQTSSVTSPVAATADIHNFTIQHAHRPTAGDCGLSCCEASASDRTTYIMAAAPRTSEALSHQVGCKVRCVAFPVRVGVMIHRRLACGLCRRRIARPQLRPQLRSGLRGELHGLAHKGGKIGATTSPELPAGLLLQLVFCCGLAHLLPRALSPFSPPRPPTPVAALSSSCPGIPARSLRHPFLDARPGKSLPSSSAPHSRQSLASCPSVIELTFLVAPVAKAVPGVFSGEEATSRKNEEHSSARSAMIPSVHRSPCWGGRSATAMSERCV